MRLLIVGLAFACTARAAPAEPFDFQRDCAKWIAQKGYTADYIEMKVGKRQPGFPNSWRGNVAPREVAVGDVVMSQIPEKGRNLRVAYVEDVRRNADGSAGAVVVSEWNFGRYIDERCLVTDHFGRLADAKPITVDAIVKVWRPSLPLDAPK